MNADERLRTDLATWMKGSQATAQDAYLEAVFAQTRTLPQRPTWTFPSRWLPWLPEAGSPARLALRLVVVGLLLLALMATSLLVGGSIREAAGDSVLGSGWRLLDGTPKAWFELDARSDASGGGAHGRYTFNFPDLGASFAGEVTCLRVDGAAAVVAGRITESQGLRGEQGFAVWVIDGGIPADGQSGPGQVSTTPTLAQAPTSCPSLELPSTESWRAVKGNIAVRDR